MVRVRVIQGPWRVLGTGSALPGEPVTTERLVGMIRERFDVDVARLSERIAQRLGVKERHFCRDWKRVGEVARAEDTNPKLAARAVRIALGDSGWESGECAYLLAHTTTPHTLLPSNVAWVADELGYCGPYLELRQACCGFAHALQCAAGVLATQGDEGTGQPAVIVGSETGSVFLDPREVRADMGQLVNLLQMGDGAGAIVLGSAGADGGGQGALLRHAFVGSLGPGLAPGFRLDAGGSARPMWEGVSTFEHDFNSVREHGPELFAAAIRGAKLAGVDVASIDYILPHQANAVELPRGLSLLLGLSVERIIMEADRVGNLGSASVWVALDRLRRSGRLRAGERVLVLGAEATKYLFGGFVYEHGG